MTSNVHSGKALPFGERLREARNERGLSLEDVARAMGVSTRQVARWQTGESGMKMARLTQLAQLLGKPPSYFLDEVAA